MDKHFAHQIGKDRRYLCDEHSPMPINKPQGSRWTHPDAIEIDEDYGRRGGVADGDFVKYKCPHCGHSWWSELPN